MFSRLKQKVKEETLSVSSSNQAGAGPNAKEDNTFSNSLKKLEEKVNEDISKSISNLERAESIETQKSIPEATKEVLKKDASRKSSHADQLDSTSAFNELNNDVNSRNADVQVLESSLRDYVDLNESLERDNKNLITDLNQFKELSETLKNQYNEFNTRVQILQIENENYEKICTNYAMEISNLRNEKDELLIKNAELSEKLEKLKHLNSLEPVNHVHPTKSSPSNVHKEKDDQIEAVSKEYLKGIRDELSEKNKVIKNLQQRLNDMKKTLQRELKFQALPNDTIIGESLSPKSNPTNTQRESLAKIHAPQSNDLHSSLSQPQSPVSLLSHPFQLSTSEQPLPNHLANGSSISNSQFAKISLSKRLSSLSMGNPVMYNESALQLDDINFKYLKYVVLKFFTSNSYEAVHLIKALSMLLKFSHDEEKALKDTLEWKMSWFGTKPAVNLKP